MSDTAGARKRRPKVVYPEIEPLLVNRVGAAQMLGVNEFEFTSGVKAGLYPGPCLHVARTRRWRVQDLRDFMSAPPAAKPAKVHGPRMPPKVPLGPGVQHLYRHFDAEGRLLYVGISLSALVRLGEHRHGSDWFWRIARVEITAYANRRSAMKAERIAIHREKPLHNIIHARRKA